MPHGYQLCTSKLFLTYPQCPVSKEDALDVIRATLLLLDNPLDIIHYVVAREHHLNGDLHLHMYLELSEQFRTRDPTKLDILSGHNLYHGNYQGVRSFKNVVKYCTKGEDYISDIDVAALCERKSTRRIIAEKLVKEKKKLHEVAMEHPEMVHDYTRWKVNLAELESDLQEVEPLPRELDNPWGLQLRTDIKEKRRHHWIWSREPNRGKSFHFGIPLSRRPGVVLATSFTYWTVGPRTNLILLDDYNVAALSFNSLNQLCDGTFDFRVFMQGYRKLGEFLVVILSNKEPKDLYGDNSKYLYERFNVFNVDSIVDSSNELDVCLNIIRE